MRDEDDMDYYMRRCIFEKVLIFTSRCKDVFRVWPNYQYISLVSRRSQPCHKASRTWWHYYYYYYYWPLLLYFHFIIISLYLLFSLLHTIHITSYNTLIDFHFSFRPRYFVSFGHYYFHYFIIIGLPFIGLMISFITYSEVLFICTFYYFILDTLWYIPAFNNTQIILLMQASLPHCKLFDIYYWLMMIEASLLVTFKGIYNR